MATKPLYAHYLDDIGCAPETPRLSASDVLFAIQSADATTKQALVEALAKCACPAAVRDIFGDDPVQSAVDSRAIFNDV